MTRDTTTPLSAKRGLTITVALVAMMLGLAGAASAGAEKMRGHVFERVDANKDDKVTADEVRPFTDKRFARFDADGDGVVSAQEIDAHLMKRMIKWRQRLLLRFDGDGDGAITKTEFTDKADDMFERVDANDDGAIDRQEARRARHKIRAIFHRHLDQEDGPGKEN